MTNRFLVAKSGNCLVCLSYSSMFIQFLDHPASIVWLDFSSEGETADRQKPWPAVQWNPTMLQYLGMAGDDIGGSKQMRGLLIRVDGVGVMMFVVHPCKILGEEHLHPFLWFWGGASMEDMPTIHFPLSHCWTLWKQYDFMCRLVLSPSQSPSTACLWQSASKSALSVHISTFRTYYRYNMIQPFSVLRAMMIIIRTRITFIAPLLVVMLGMWLSWELRQEATGVRRRNSEPALCLVFGPSFQRCVGSCMRRIQF